MDFGRISRNSQPLRLDEWNQLIDSHDFLRPIPDRRGTNPFTKEEVLFSGEGKAFYVENGEMVGNIALEDGELKTTGVPVEICRLLAERLGAHVIEDDRS
jgi:hypothetical protein